jgi:type I restriction enzyme S subunit
VNNPTVQLEEIAEIVQGGRHKLSGNQFVPRGYPAYGAGGLNGYLESFEFEEVAIVLSSIGARCGKCFFANGRWSSLANTQVIRPDTKQADAKFLWFQLNDENRWPRAGTGQPFIKPSDVKSHKVFLPDLSEQRRIAGELERADGLRRTRRYALELADTFLPAAFLQLFGSTGNEFPISIVEDLLADKRNAIRTGPFGSQLLHSEFTDSGIAVLGIDNAVNNSFEWSQRRYITPEKYEQLKRYTVFPGDVIITLMGTCGRCAIVPDDIPTAINTKHLCCITLDQARCLPVFLQGAFLYHPFVRQQLSMKTKGSIMEGLNMGIIQELRIPLPPPALQTWFAELVERHERLRSVQRESLRQAEHLFQSLLHQTFAKDN